MDKNCLLLHGITTVGERGQIVIPQNIRESMKIKAGDDMVVMAQQGKIVVLPAQALEAYYGAIIGQLNTVRGAAKSKKKK